MRVPRFLAMLVGIHLASGVLTSVAQIPRPVPIPLTNAVQIRQLSATEAAQSIPVHLRGVAISEAGPTNRAAVIWDGTANIYLLALTNLFSGVKRGDLLEAEGVTDPGQFAPIVKVTSAWKIGSAPTPPAQPATFEELLSGALDAQWVEVSGIVRNIDVIEPGGFGQWHMEVATGGGKVSVVANGPRPLDVVPDAQVHVQAACFYQFTQRRQVLRPMLLVPAGVCVEVLKPAPAEPEAASVRPAGSLLEFKTDNALGHRVHVRGLVTHQEPGSTVWLRDESGALRIQTKQSEILQPGDEIHVFGFPKYGSYTPTLEDAVFKKGQTGNSPVALDLATPEAAFDHPGDLISLEATLTEIQRIPDGWTLTLEKNRLAFKAIFKSASNITFAGQCQPGSVVCISGICSVITDDAEPVVSGVWRPPTFQLLIRSPGDLVTIKAPPWWTPKHIIFLSLSIAGGSVLVAGIVSLLARRRLRDQAHRRAMAEAEFAAILSERNRVAREIHDTLAQGLAATSVHLRLAKKNANGSSQAVEHHLNVAQQLVQDSLKEARTSIWNMRSQVLETGDLAAALKGILQQMADGTDLKINFQAVGRARRLAPMLENNILRIGQEAISNAIRHAEAKSVSVNLVFGEKHFRLNVEDDGRGFDPAKPPPGDGGFGLVGMRERTTHINGQLEIRSSPGHGTELTLQIPTLGD